VIAVLAIFFALISEGYPVVTNWFLNGFGMRWSPQSGMFGAIPYIYVTFYGGIGCTLVATIIGVPTAIYLAEFADKRLRNIVKPCLEVLTGLPSVVIGIVGACILLQAISRVAGLGTGGGILAIWIVVGVMSIPTVATISEDAIKAVAKDLKEASLGLGATRWQTMTRVIIPVAMPGILAAILLGMGNAMGETMAAYFIMGNGIPKISLDLIHGTGWIPAEIAKQATSETMGDMAPFYALGLILFVIIGVLNLIIRRLSRERATETSRKR
jgi:phosphate ABC transporter permease protein PstC